MVSIRRARGRQRMLVFGVNVGSQGLASGLILAVKISVGVGAYICGGVGVLAWVLFLY